MKNKISLRILLIIYIVIGIALVGYPLFYIRKSIDKQTERIEERNLYVKNNSIYLGERELYRLIPIEGGNLEIGGISRNINLEHSKNDSNARYLFNKKKVNGFIIGETPVTLELWNYVHADTLPDNDDGLTVYVCGLSPKQWMSFVEKLNALTGRTFRMPTSEEWEYAARGGIYSHGYMFSGSNDIDEVAIYGGNYTKEKVDEPDVFFDGKMKKPNELGLYDMSGGVWELTSTLQLYKDPINIIFYNQFLEKKRKGTLSEDELLFLKAFEQPLARGGAFYSSKEECEINCISNDYQVTPKTGLRLVLEY